VEQLIWNLNCLMMRDKVEIFSHDKIKKNAQ